MAGMPYLMGDRTDDSGRGVNAQEGSRRNTHVYDTNEPLDNSIAGHDLVDVLYLNANPRSNAYQQWLRHRSQYEAAVAYYSLPQHNVTILRSSTIDLAID